MAILETNYDPSIPLVPPAGLALDLHDAYSITLPVEATDEHFRISRAIAHLAVATCPNVRIDRQYLGVPFDNRFNTTARRCAPRTAFSLMHIMRGTYPTPTGVANQVTLGLQASSASAKPIVIQQLDQLGEESIFGVYDGNKLSRTADSPDYAPIDLIPESEVHDILNAQLWILGLAREEDAETPLAQLCDLAGTQATLSRRQRWGVNASLKDGSRLRVKKTVIHTGSSFDPTIETSYDVGLVKPLIADGADISASMQIAAEFAHDPTDPTNSLKHTLQVHRALRKATQKHLTVLYVGSDLASHTLGSLGAARDQLRVQQSN
jgi:hypothetical protein